MCHYGSSECAGVFLVVVMRKNLREVVRLAVGKSEKVDLTVRRGRGVSAVTMAGFLLLYARDKQWSETTTRTVRTCWLCRCAGPAVFFL
jgi:hypothetical protein